MPGIFPKRQRLYLYSVQLSYILDFVLQNKKQNVLRKNADGRYTGYFPDLDDCTFEGSSIDEAIDAAIAAEKDWIEVQMDEDDEYGAEMPFISDHEDIPLKEGEFIRDIAVIMHFEVGYY